MSPAFPADQSVPADRSTSAGQSVPAGQRTLRDLLADTAAALGSVTEARWVLEHAAGLDGASLTSRLGDVAPPALGAEVESLVQRRVAGEPLQYVLGSWAFRSLELLVDPRVLIPRPETEAVVGVALDQLRAGEPGARVVADLGTGSGAIALSLAAEGPGDLEIWASDASAEALEVARANLAALAARSPDAAARVRLVEGAWFDALPAHLLGSLSLVVSNPPYVASAEWQGLDPVVRDHEPRRALVSGDSGLEDIGSIVTDAGRWMAPGGMLVVEIAPHQSGRARAAATGAGFRQVRVEEDLAGRPRALVARWPGP